VGTAEQVEQADPDAIAVSHDEAPRTRPPSDPPAPTNRGHQSADLRLLALQIEQQKLEIKKLELEAQIKANTTSPLVKPETVPSLLKVRQSPNAGESLGQLDFNVRIVAPQEWPHLHVPFGLAKKKFKDLSLAEFVYGYLDIMRDAGDEHQEFMSTHLMTLMRLAAKYKWLSVLSFHAAVLDRIEASLASWGDDFTELERFNITESDRLPLLTKQKNQPTARPPGFPPKTYCKEWNRTGTCSNQSHRVGTEHVCAYCKLPDHTIASCPTRPATTNASSIPSPSSA
ncbi:hypothetical protein P5673_032862, partial [Acropora cervicornis]